LERVEGVIGEEKIADGFDEGPAEAYDLAVRRWHALTWVRTCAIARWEIS
jgi:hypothetical protein